MRRQIRPLRIDGNIAYVPLTKGYEAAIDVDDAEAVGKFNWYAKVREHTVYACRCDRSSGNKKILHMHRVIVNPSDGKEVDHIDHNGLNNRRSNLRVCSRGENCRNVKVVKETSSKLKGVTWHKRSGKWRAQINCNGKNIYLGSFSDEQSAHQAYCKASTGYHKQYGYTEK